VWNLPVTLYAFLNSIGTLVCPNILFPQHDKEWMEMAQVCSAAELTITMSSLKLGGVSA